MAVSMKKQSHFTPEAFKFLKAIKRHNNRDWFQKHKQEYLDKIRDPFLQFITDFGPRLKQISPHFIANPKPMGGSLLRIYKDLRFRPDAPPYQTHAAARFPHVAWKQLPCPGFYLHITPGQSFLAMGLWRPQPEVRARVRQAIGEQPATWKKVTRSKRFTSHCVLGGESASRMPPGFAIDHPLAEDLKRKDFICSTEFSDDEVCAADFLDRVVRACEASGPFMEFLTRALELPWAEGETLKLREISNVEQFTLE